VSFPESGVYFRHGRLRHFDREQRHGVSELNAQSLHKIRSARFKVVAERAVSLLGTVGYPTKNGGDFLGLDRAQRLRPHRIKDH